MPPVKKIMRRGALISLAVLASCQETPSGPTVLDKDGISSQAVPWVGYRTTGPQRTGWILNAAGKPVQITFEVHNGSAIWSGDIDLGPADGIATTREALMRLPGEGRFSMILSRSDRRWLHGRVPYEISSDLPDAGRVLRGIETLVRETNGVILVPRTDEEDYIRFVPSTGCSSRYGRTGGGQEIKLAADCDAGAVQHEIMHAIGYMHEHQRCDRRYYIDILFENVESGKESQFESMCDSGDISGTDYGPYDETSIMHYGTSYFSRNGQPTIRSLRGRDNLMGSRTLSPGDLDAVDVLYGDNNDAPTLVFTPPASQHEGTVFEFDASGTFDPDDPSLRFIWNFGDGTCDVAPPKPADCSDPSPSHRYTQSGKYTGRVAVTDGYALARATFVIEVLNDRPRGHFEGPARVTEGSTIFYTLLVDDAGRDDVTIEFSSGTGAPAITSTLPLSGPYFNGPETQFTMYRVDFPKSGEFTLTAFLTDSEGATTLVRFPVIVENSAPSTRIAALAPQYTSGETIPFAMELSDTGIFDGPWSYSWDVGFRSPIVGSTSSLGRIELPQQACVPGTWPTALTVTDREGASSSVSRELIIVPYAVAIDVLPGNATNGLSLSRPGLLSSAILGSPTFDVHAMDVATITLGDGLGTDIGIAQRKNGALHTSLDDVNGDGIADLLLMFDMDALRQAGEVGSSSTQLTLRGRQRDGCTHVRGSDAVRPVR